MKKTILVIEDNEQNLYLVTFILEKHGYHVEAAQDGQEGITLATRMRPDLILLDVQLPVMDGYEATRRIKANAELKAIPVIAVTSYALSGDEAKARAAGCDAYVAKPFSPRQLLAKVREYLPS